MYNRLQKIYVYNLLMNYINTKDIKILKSLRYKRIKDKQMMKEEDA